MARRQSAFAPTTDLGRAISARRGERRQADVALEANVRQATISKLERGEGMPSYDTAVKLARWLNWSIEQVMSAAASGG